MGERGRERGTIPSALPGLHYEFYFSANNLSFFPGIFEAILTAEDAVLSDELNHASIIDGIRLCKARRIRYKHADMAALEQELKNSQVRSHCFRIVSSERVSDRDRTRREGEWRG